MFHGYGSVATHGHTLRTLPASARTCPHFPNTTTTCPHLPALPQQGPRLPPPAHTSWLPGPCRPFFSCRRFFF